jgi:quercetin dioxygenase-like cupin family protein
MSPKSMNVLLCLLTTPLLLSCSEGRASPTAPAQEAMIPTTAPSTAVHSMHTGAITIQALEPFSFRTTLEPFRIQQLPDFMMHSKSATDIVFQRSVFAPGAGMWHTHPGPSFVYVIEGEIRLDRYSGKAGCTQTPVFEPGDAYFEVADEVHRAVVVSATPAVLLVTRFNIPVGGPITIPADDPGC